MGTVHSLPLRAHPDADGVDTVPTAGAHVERAAVPDVDTVVARLAHLMRLEVELGVAETRDFLFGLAVAVVVALVGAVALIASLVVLLAAALSPLFAAPWQPLLVAGGGVALVAAAALGWSAWRLTHLSWPKETLRSFEENWRWLVLQLRSRLTLSRPVA